MQRLGSGLYVNYSTAMRVHDITKLTQFIIESLGMLVGGTFYFEENPDVAAELMMAHMDKKCKALKLHPFMYTASFLSRITSQKTTEKNT